MVTAEHREPYEVRASRTVLGARRGEIPLRDSLIIFGKLVKAPYLCHDLHDGLLTQCLNALGQHYSTTSASLSETVIEFTDFGCGIGITHGMLSIICVADHSGKIPRRSWR